LDVRHEKSRYSVINDGDLLRENKLKIKITGLNLKGMKIRSSNES